MLDYDFISLLGIWRPNGPGQQRPRLRGAFAYCVAGRGAPALKRGALRRRGRGGLAGRCCRRRASAVGEAGGQALAQGAQAGALAGDLQRGVALQGVDHHSGARLPADTPAPP